MTVNQWPPKVWHGVVDPQTGEKIPPVTLDASAGCDDCERLRSGLTWTGDEPPKCAKHKEHNVTFTGGIK